MSAASKSCCNGNGLLGWLTVVQAVPDDAATALILLTNWCYTKMDRRQIIIICILYLIIHGLIVYKILSKLVNECLRYSKPKQRRFRASLKRPNFWGSRFPR